MAATQDRWAMCLEQTLGHRAHSRNLESVSSSLGLDVDIIHVDYPESRIRIPWAARGSYQARKKLRAAGTRYSVVFYHTQTVALLANTTRASQKFVVSVDATPRQIDSMGQWYNHGTSASPFESLKARLYRRMFRDAAAVVAWSDWAAASLVNDYHVAENKITVAHPGAPAPFFEIPRAANERKPQLLFVGGDFQRKGGPALLNAFERFRDRAGLTIVSDDAVPETPGVTVERGIRPATERLYAAYAAADIFCFPTRGDCTPLVLGEAMAAGLPVITTNIGSNRETLQGGQGGLLVSPGRDDELVAALERLISNAEERRTLGENARRIARQRLDARKNGERIFELMGEVAS